MKRFFLSFFSLALIGASSNAFAAACCGGGFAAPSVIVGDDAGQLTASYGINRVTDDVGTDSLWRRRERAEDDEVLKIEAAHIFWDRWQSGVSIPVVRRARSGETSSGLGDVAATLGYEILPDWDYNPWRPRGVGFLQLTLPTGKAINESDISSQLDARGRGFWAVGAGAILTKTFTRWDFHSSFGVHRSFEKTYANSQSQGTLTPGFGGDVGAGAGYSIEDFRFGGALAWTSEDAVDVRGTVDTDGTPQRFTTASLSVNYMFENEWAGTLSYVDQTSFGNPLNTSLGRGLAIVLQKRWLR